GGKEIEADASISFNYAQYGSAIYNIGTFKLGSVAIVNNIFDTHSQIYNGGVLEITDNTAINNDQMIFLAVNTMNDYKFITVSKNDFVNENDIDGSLNITFDNYFLNAVIVKFVNEEGYIAYKNIIETGAEQVFKILNNEEYKIGTNDGQKALVINYQKYDIIFGDLTGDNNVNIPVELIQANFGTAFDDDYETVEVDTNEDGTPDGTQTLTLIETINTFIPTRNGYDFVSWAYYLDASNRPGIPADGSNFEIYDVLDDAETNYFLISKLVEDGVKISTYNFYLYAVWAPFEFDIVYVYDDAYTAFGAESYLVAGNPVDDSNLAGLTQTIKYNESFNVASIDDIYEVDFVAYFEYSEMNTDAEGNPVSLTYGDSKTAVVTFSDELGYYFILNSITYVYDGVDTFYSVFNKDYEIVNTAGDNKYLYPQQVVVTGEDTPYTVILTDGRYSFVYDGLTYIYRQYYRPDYYAFSRFDINGKVFEPGVSFEVNEYNEAYSYVEVEGKKVIYITINFERMSSTVIVNANGGEGGFQYICYAGEEFVLPSYSTTVIYNGDAQFVYYKDFALRGFAEKVDGQVFEVTSIIVPETASAMYILYAIWDEAVCFIDDAVEKNGIKYDVYYASIEEAVADINGDIDSVIFTSVAFNDTDTETTNDYNLYITKDTTINEKIVVNRNFNIIPYAGTLTISNGISLDLTDSIIEVAEGYTLNIGNNDVSSNNLVFSISTTVDNPMEASFMVVNGTVNLLKGVEFVNCSTTNNGGAVTVNGTLNIKGTKFFGNTAKLGGAIYVATGATLNIFEATFGQQNDANSANYGGAIYVETGANLLVQREQLATGEPDPAANVMFVYNEADYGGAIYVAENANVLIINGTFITNSASYGGAIYTNSSMSIGNNNINYVEFNGNIASQDGGAIFIAEGIVEVEFANFASNRATQNGGAIASATATEFEEVNAEIIINGGKFNLNIASIGNGGAIYSNCNVSVSSINADTNLTIFNGNIAVSGGAIYITTFEGHSLINLNLLDVIFTANYAKVSGGALYIEQTNVRINENTSLPSNGVKDGLKTTDGGAIYASKNANVVIDGSLKNNNASANGGAVYARSNAIITLNGNALIDGNKAGTNGGAFFLTDSSVIIMMSADLITISNNEASNGGAIYFMSSSEDSVLQNGVITGNKANISTASRGGAIYLSSGKLSISGVQINENTANKYGGAVYVCSGAVLSITSGRIYENDVTDTAKAGTDVYLEYANSESYAEFEIGSFALVENIYMTGSTFIKVTSDLKSDFTIASNLIKLEFDEVSEGRIIATFTAPEKVTALPFIVSEEVGRDFYLQAVDVNLMLAKLASSVIINPNGGLITYNGEDHTEAFEIQFGEYIRPGDSFALLNDVTGYYFGKDLSSTFEGNDTFEYRANSIIPMYKLELTAIWVEKIILANKVVEDEISPLENNITLSQDYFLEGETKPYNTFVGWEVAYMQDEELKLTGLVYTPYSNFKLTDLNKDQSITNSTYTYLSVYEAIVENNQEIYFVALFERTPVHIVINGNDGKTVADNLEVYEFIKYQDELELNLYEQRNIFVNLGFILTGFFDGVDNRYVEGIDTFYLLTDNIDISGREEVEIYCYWKPAEAYIKAGNGSSEDRYFLTFTEALANAKDNDTIVVINDFDVTESITINKAITIVPGRNVKISRAMTFSTDYLFKIEADVTFGDSSSNILTIDGKGVESSTAGIYVASFRTLKLFNSVAIINNINGESNGGAIYSDGNLEILGGNISYNEAINGGAVYANGEITIKVGIISENEATNGGGIYLAATSRVVEMNNCNITYNLAKNGAGIYYASQSSNFLSSGNVSNNNTYLGGSLVGGIGTDYHGGGIYVALNSGNLRIGAVNIKDNASYYGGGIYVEGNNSADNTQMNVSLESTVLTGNKATVGAGLSVTDGNNGYKFQNVEITSTTIQQNSADIMGGGIAVLGGKLFFKSGLVSQNTANSIGSEIYIASISSTDYASVTVYSATFGEKKNDIEPLATEPANSEIYVSQYARFVLNGEYTIYSDVKLESGAFIRVDRTIADAQTRINIVPNYELSLTAEYKVVEFATDVENTPINFTIDEELHANYRLKAVGQQIILCESNFELTFDANLGTLDTSLEAISKTSTTVKLLVKTQTNLDYILNAISVSRDHRYFEGWNTKPDGTGVEYKTDDSATMPYSDLNLYATWSQTYYILTVNFNDSVGSTQHEFSGKTEEYVDGKIRKEVFTDTHLTNYGNEALLDVFNTVTRVGYTIVGFSTSQTGEGVVYRVQEDDDGNIVVNGFAMPEEDVSMYIIWEANQYEIVYNSNKPETASKDIKGEIGNTVCIFDEYNYVTSTTFVLPGWTQISWNTAADGSGETYTLGQKIKNLLSEQGSTFELFAIYEANTYVVNYDANKPISSTAEIEGTVSSTTHIYDILSPVRGEDEKFSLLGWTQINWNTAADGSGREVSLGDEIFDLAEEGNITLYAIWRPNTYYIRYSSNGGTTGTTHDETYSYDSEFPLMTAATLGFTKTHHNFMGWSTTVITSVTNTGVEVEYEDGQLIKNLVSSDGGVYYLYAVWEVYSATVYGNNGNEEDLVKVYANPSSGEVAITKEKISSLVYLGFEIGYLNDGPSISGEGHQFDANDSMVIALTENIDLYVIWKAIVYRVDYLINRSGATGTQPESQYVWAYNPASVNTYAVENANTDTNTITLPGKGNLVAAAGDLVTLCGWALTADSIVIDYDLNAVLVLSHEELVKMAEKQEIDVTDDVITFYGLWSYTYNVHYDLNTTYNIVKGSTTDILGVNKSTTDDMKSHIEHTVINKDIHGKVWEIFDETNVQYAYFLGWSTDRTATTPEFVGGEEIRYIEPTTLYAVWKDYTNPNYFSYDAGKITGFSTVGENAIVSNNITEILFPRYNPATGEKITQITKFEDSAAANKVQVISFEFMDYLETIADLTFEHFSELTSALKLPDSIKTIGNGAFAAENLVNISFVDDAEKYKLDDFGNLLAIDGSGFKLHTYLITNSNNVDLKEVSLNNEFTEILPYAFYKTKITSLYTNSNLNAIGFAALKGVDTIVEISVPFAGNNATENTFLAYLFGVENITVDSTDLIPQSLIKVTITNQPAVPANALRGFKFVQEVVVEGLVDIGEYAFYNCEKLVKLNATNLSNFNIENVVTIGSYAFDGCKALPTSLEFSNKLTKIGNYSFARTNLEYVYIPRNVAQVSKFAFVGCSSLKAARVYSTAAFSAVTDMTGDKTTGIKEGKDNGSVIYTDVNFYLVLLKVHTPTLNFLDYNIVVDDLIELFNSDGEFKAYYNNIYDAVENAKNNDIVMVKLDIELDDTVVIAPDVSKGIPVKNIVIIAGNSDIPDTDEAYAYYGNTIRDVKITRNTDKVMFQIKDTNNVVFGREFYKTGYTTSTLILEGDVDNVSASIISVESSAGLTLENKVVLQNNYAENGGAIYVAGDLTINGAEIINNKAENKGGAIYVDSGILTINAKTKLTGNQVVSSEDSTNGGGAIYVAGDGQLVITSGAGDGEFVDISYNSAAFGGAIYFASNHTQSKIVGGKITNNGYDSSTSCGGAIYQSGTGVFTISNAVEIENNFAYFGGALYIANGKFVVSDATIGGSAEKANMAYHGGGVYIASSATFDVNSSSSNISFNKAQVNGGNIYFASTVTTESTIGAGSISNGEAANNGGGIFLTSGILKIS
ncbi:MAG: leucine-rich repeat protein, partial [Clostridia bacterium]|nr:leucine-rich repeat protein [Clostridia bacterium]